jgi:hypothetical protein
MPFVARLLSPDELAPLLLFQKLFPGQTRCGVIRGSMKVLVIGSGGPRARAGLENSRSPRAWLDFLVSADIMSDMKIFTVRELDRRPAEVLDAADRDGTVRIKRRDGRVYSLQPVASSSSDKITALPDFRARVKKIFSRPIPRKIVADVDRLIAGE